MSLPQRASLPNSPDRRNSPRSGRSSRRTGVRNNCNTRGFGPSPATISPSGMSPRTGWTGRWRRVAWRTRNCAKRFLRFTGNSPPIARCRKCWRRSRRAASPQPSCPTARPTCWMERSISLACAVGWTRFCRSRMWASSNRRAKFTTWSGKDSGRQRTKFCSSPPTAGTQPGPPPMASTRSG